MAAVHAGAGALWVSFALIAALMLALDLGVFNRTAREPTPREALAWTAAWLALAATFAVAVTVLRGGPKGLEFTTAYLVEEALSVDNLFVIMLVFAQLAVPKAAQRRVLTWGILGAVVLRGAMLFAGAELVSRFHVLTYALGAVLVASAIKLLAGKEPREDVTAPPPPSRPVRLLARVVPLTDSYMGARFTVVRAGVRYATPLLAALVTIEAADAVFALDSIPAVLGVSTDRQVVFTSNLFAVLGLRSLYFVLAGLLSKLAYLKQGLALVLAIVGAKMLLAGVWATPAWLSLLAVLVALGGAVVASLVFKPKENVDAQST